MAVLGVPLPAVRPTHYLRQLCLHSQLLLNPLSTLLHLLSPSLADALHGSRLNFTPHFAFKLHSTHRGFVQLNSFRSARRRLTLAALSVPLTSA